MKRLILFLFALTLFFPKALHAEDAPFTALTLNTLWAKKHIVICGDDKIRIIDPEKSDSSHIEVVWEWTKTDAQNSGMPSNYVNYFKTMDECKPVDNNTRLLVTSSAGGAAVIDIATKKCLFYANTPNAHSICTLPAGRLAVALSTGSTAKANSVCIYDQVKNDVIVFRDSLYSGHGVTWNAKTERLYALGYQELRAYKLTNWDTSSPSLTLDKTYAMPASGCHDLSPITNNYYLITASGTGKVYIFDVAKGTCSPYQPMQGGVSIKSVNLDSVTGQIVYTEPEESWWTFHVKAMYPGFCFPVPDQKVYKVRIFQ